MELHDESGGKGSSVALVLESKYLACIVHGDDVTVCRLGGTLQWAEDLDQKSGLGSRSVGPDAAGGLSGCWH